MKIGGKYNWIGQRERLVYLGKNWSGNGYWHQFAKVDEPSKVWCEVLDSDLPMIEETKMQAHAKAVSEMSGMLDTDTYFLSKSPAHQRHPGDDVCQTCHHNTVCPGTLC